MPSPLLTVATGNKTLIGSRGRACHVNKLYHADGWEDHDWIHSQWVNRGDLPTANILLEAEAPDLRAFARAR